MALAMLLAVNSDVSKQLADICLLICVFTIIFTVCFNGLTIKFIMKWINFVPRDEIKEQMRNNVFRKLVINTI